MTASGPETTTVPDLRSGHLERVTGIGPAIRALFYASRPKGVLATVTP
jgi:hypothetical protein